MARGTGWNQYRQPRGEVARARRASLYNEQVAAEEPLKLSG
jgi:hypothetical protein